MNYMLFISRILIRGKHIESSLKVMKEKVKLVSGQFAWEFAS